MVELKLTFLYFKPRRIAGLHEFAGLGVGVNIETARIASYLVDPLSVDKLGEHGSVHWAGFRKTVVNL
jgi:hypothetical protein